MQTCIFRISDRSRPSRHTLSTYPCQSSQHWPIIITSHRWPIAAPPQRHKWPLTRHQQRSSNRLTARQHSLHQVEVPLPTRGWLPRSTIEVSISHASTVASWLFPPCLSTMPRSKRGHLSSTLRDTSQTLTQRASKTKVQSWVPRKQLIRIMHTSKIVNS